MVASRDVGGRATSISDVATAPGKHCVSKTRLMCLTTSTMQRSPTFECETQVEEIVFY